MQQFSFIDLFYWSIWICSTCFGRQTHPFSGALLTVYTTLAQCTDIAVDRQQYRCKKTSWPSKMGPGKASESFNLWVLYKRWWCFLKVYNIAHQQRNHGWARSPNYVSSVQKADIVLCYARPPTGCLIAHGTTESCNVGLCLYFILSGVSWKSYGSTFEQPTVAEHAKALPAATHNKFYVLFFTPCILIWLCNKHQQNTRFLN